MEECINPSVQERLDVMPSDVDLAGAEIELLDMEEKECILKKNLELLNGKYDFIIIRGNLDGSKYGVDIATELARNNPQYRFLLIGKGQFYQHYARPDNLEWINNVMSHDEIVQYMNQAKCALMPTRQDTQGLMTCEMATYGIPTITSDIPVCHEICDAFDNVKLIDNSNTALDLTPLLDELQKGVPYPKNPQYFAENTIGKEIVLFEKLAGRS